MSSEDIYKQHLNDGHQAALDAVYEAGAAAERVKQLLVASFIPSEYITKAQAEEFVTQAIQQGIAQGRAAILAEIDAAAHANAPEITPQTPQATPTQPAIAEPSPQPQATITPVAPGAPLSL